MKTFSMVLLGMALALALLPGCGQQQGAGTAAVDSTAVVADTTAAATYPALEPRQRLRQAAQDGQSGGELLVLEEKLDCALLQLGGAGSPIRDIKRLIERWQDLDQHRGVLGRGQCRL